MFGRVRTRHNLLDWALPALFSLCVAHVAIGRESGPRVGTLRLEGAEIERVVLQDSTGVGEVFYYREPNLVVRAGTYRLDEVVLQGDYSCSGLQIPAAMRVVKIEPGGLVTLKLGAPLRQTVQVERWGRSLVLNHRLLGQGGESYRVTQRQASKPPAFVIYQGENKLVSGDFTPG
jgi:hypothetical protein